MRVTPVELTEQVTQSCLVKVHLLVSVKVSAILPFGQRINPVQDIVSPNKSAVLVEEGVYDFGSRQVLSNRLATYQQESRSLPRP